MTRGRKRIPSKIIALKGGKEHTHRPDNDQEPTPPEKMPKCPKHLDKVARKEWKRSGKVLESIGLLTELDMMILAAYCEAYSRWVQATNEIQKTSMVYKKADGSPGLNPWLKVAKDGYEQMLKSGTLIGMSPTSRANLKVQKPKAKSKTQKFRERKKGASR